MLASGVWNCKRLFDAKVCVFQASYNVCLIQNSFVSTTRRFVSGKRSKDDSFTATYLINSCGLPPESAKRVSKYLHLESTQRADSVIALFSNLGFTKSQISWIVRGVPQLLRYIDPERRLKPKIEFLYSLGMSRSDVAMVVSFSPYILGRSLERKIVPSFEILKGLLRSNEKIVCAIKRYPQILRTDYQSRLVANVDMLRKHYGVPQSNIVLLITQMTRGLALPLDTFKAVADSVLEMGIDPLKSSFVIGIYVKGVLSKSKWEKKFNSYKNLGWSDEEIRQAFVKLPWCMLHSEDKVREMTDILVNKMGWKSSDIAQNPTVLGLSLKKRILPRCSVIEFLFSKGLVDRSVKVSTAFCYSEKQFLNKFVVPYESEAPYLLKLYQEQIE